MTAQQQKRGGMGRAAALILLGVIAVAVGIWVGELVFDLGSERDSITADLKSATLLPEPKPLDNFSLTAQDNQTLNLDSLKGRWTFLAFGYTHCPDVCPTLMATFDALDKALSKSSTDAKPEFLFISVDPERDTPERIDKYVRFFNPRIQGATAGQEVLRPLTAQVGVMYQRSDAQDTATGYLVDHTASILLLDPKARLTAIFGYPHDPRAMAEDFRAISEQR